ncbi:cytochrome P450 2J6-like [Chrysemys picta bellii]|uniref:cytochrome P450 2J6-like n=1 Tax=Chrysemys picta bellii TaxID=8478 RepID=UPI0032B2F5B1
MLVISEFLVALVISLFVVQFLKLKWACSRLPPGPTPLPLIGTMLQMDFKRQHENLIKLAQIYGNIFTLWIGHIPIIILNGFPSVKDGLTTHSEATSGRPTTPFLQKTAGGKGISFTSGHTWKQQRRFGLMTLRNLGLGKKGLEHRIQEEARHLVEYFMNERGDPLDPSFPIVHSVSNVIAAVVFGHRFSIEDKNFHQLIENNDYMVQHGSSIFELLYDVFPWLMDHLPGTHQKVFYCQEFVRSFARKEIRSHQESGSPDEPQDFIDFYLAQIDKSKADPDSTFDEDNLVQTVFDLFLAGTETTTTTLRWAVLYMVTYPDVQEKVQKELDAELGPSQLICYEDRKNLPYTNAVIHEIQRYSNIVAVGIPRTCVKDTMLQGFPIEKGTIILPNLTSALLDPEQWETPRQFNPNHFLDQDGNFVTKEAFLPFSAGPRVCLGEHLARTELFIFFTNLLRAFTFRLPEGVKEINTEPMLGGLLQPHPYKICAVPR